MRKNAKHLIINQTLSIDFIWCYKLLKMDDYKEININGILIAEDGFNDDENIEDIKKQIKEFVENISGIYIGELNFE